MKKIFAVPIAICLFMTCQNSNGIEEVKSPVDSLVTAWADSWTNHDSITLINMFEHDAILIAGNYVIENHEDLMAIWIRPSLNDVKELKIKKSRDWVSYDRAGFSGRWTIEVVIDNQTYSSSGAFTCNWKKSDTGEWKVTNAHISAITEQD
jgi:ketosteroid isomerase-like protein